MLASNNCRFLAFLVLAILISGCRNQSSSSYPITEVRVVEDENGTMVVNDFRWAAATVESKPVSEIELKREISTYWVYFKLPDTSNKHWILEIPHVDTAHAVYMVDNTFEMSITGEDIPIHERSVVYGVWPCLQFETDDDFVILRLTSRSLYSRQFRNLSGIELHEAKPFLNYVRTTRYFHGIFLGIMIAMIFYNFIIFLMYNEKTFLVYSTFMFTQTLYHLSITGFLKEFAFSNTIEVGKYSPFVLAGISLCAYVWFSKSYLNAKTYAPKLNRWYSGMYFIIIPLTSIGLFTEMKAANGALLLCGVVVVVIPFIIAIKAQRKGYTAAKFFLAASILSYISYVIFTLMALKLIHEVFITRYAFQICFAGQSLLFAMGLGNRMNTLRKELALKKIEKERLQKEQEREMKELLEKQNVELEAKVKERTLQLEEKNRIVEQDREIIKHERQKSEDLLLNILPNSIADRLKEGNEMIADHFDEVSVFFADLVGFTQLSKAMRPSELVNLLNKIFSEFDKTADKYGIEKIKTIGDAYMCVGGLPIADKDHASKMAHFALEIVDVLKSFEPELGEHKCAVRIGVHCGPVVAGVIGKRKFAYDLWGDTVNMASRLESHGVPMRVQCSENFAQALGAEFKLETRGEVALKGAGTYTTYFLEKAEPVTT